MTPCPLPSPAWLPHRDSSVARRDFGSRRALLQADSGGMAQVPVPTNPSPCGRGLICGSAGAGCASPKEAVRSPKPPPPSHPQYEVPHVDISQNPILLYITLYDGRTHKPTILRTALPRLFYCRSHFWEQTDSSRRGKAWWVQVPVQANQAPRK